MRFNELDEVVDYFVLVESIETQRGNPKPLYFAEHKQDFAPYLSKIIHVIVEEEHPEFEMWDREHYQRNAILKGLGQCEPDDLILISDVDEIPKKSLIPHIKKELKRFKLDAIGFNMTLYRFQLNRTAPDNNYWWGTVATTYASVLKNTPQYYRDKREKWGGFKHAGWHFTWMGDRDKIRQKMLSVVEGSDDISQLTDEAVDKWIQSTPPVPIYSTFPSYILQNQEYLKKIGLIADY